MSDEHQVFSEHAAQYIVHASLCGSTNRSDQDAVGTLVRAADKVRLHERETVPPGSLLRQKLSGALVERAA